MKKFLSMAAMVVTIAVALSSQAEAKFWLLSSFSAGATGPGLRGELGNNLVYDVYINSNFLAPPTAQTTPLYVDLYMGSWGIAAVSPNLRTGITNWQLQYAAEQWINDKIGIGVSVNLIDYAQQTKGLGIATGLNSYVMVAL